MLKCQSYSRKQSGEFLWLNV